MAGLRFGCFLRFLRCLRFAKPRYTERTLRRVQFHVSPPFHTFCFRDVIAGGFTPHLISHKSGFHRKFPIKGQHFVLFVYKHILHLSRLAHWLWRRCFLLDFTKAIVYPTSLLCCSGVGAVRVSSPEPSSASLPFPWMVFLYTLSPCVDCCCLF